MIQSTDGRPLVTDEASYIPPSAWQEQVEQAHAEQVVKFTPPRVTKLQKRLMSMRDFLRTLSAHQVEEAQRVYNAFIKPRFQWVPPRNRVSQAKRRRYARQGRSR